MFISGDLEEFQGENSGGKHTAEFYDYFPELEDAVREYTLEQCSRKSADFTARGKVRNPGILNSLKIQEFPKIL